MASFPPRRRKKTPDQEPPLAPYPLRAAIEANPTDVTLLARNPTTARQAHSPKTAGGMQLLASPKHRSQDASCAVVEGIAAADGLVPAAR